MSNVNLLIGGRHFTVACAKGEEARVAELGRMIDAKVVSMGELAGQSEARMLLFAALLLADELHETKEHAAAAPPPYDPELIERAGHRLESIAVQLEKLAEGLEDLSPEP